MSWLLDTNVIAEWVRPRPDPGLTEWLAGADEHRCFLSVVTLAEIRHGVERLPHGRRRTRLDAWIRDHLPDRFTGRIIPVDQGVAECWGRVVAEREAAGRPIGAMDAFIAATARAHHLRLVTRNRRDFEATLPDVLCPWSD